MRVRDFLEKFNSFTLSRCIVVVQDRTIPSILVSLIAAKMAEVIDTRSCIAAFQFIIAGPVNLAICPVAMLQT
jgi:hypothetical protein